MKHLVLASPCSASAASTMLSSLTVTRGRSTTSVKRPPPSPVSAMVPRASSV